QGKEVGHDAARGFFRSLHFDMELSGINASAFDFQTLILSQSTCSGSHIELPPRRRPLNLTAVTFHYFKFIRQSFKNRLMDYLPHGVRTTFEDARSGEGRVGT